MGNKTPMTVRFDLPNGREVTIETGKLATQADGAVVVKCGNTMLFCSVVSAHSVREGQDFFPLSVDYQEKFAAAGRIPGNFFRRETRLNDYEILISRIVDRAIRPLFPKGYMFDTQVIINLISLDPEVMPDALAGLAASAALMVSDVPFAGPISECRVARIDGEYVINPDRSALKNADLDVIVAADKDNIMMVEGEAKEVDEAALLGALKAGHAAIKPMCEVQLKLREMVGVTTRPVEEPEDLEEMIAYVEGKVKDAVMEVSRAGLDKKTRKDSFGQVKENFKAAVLEEKGEEWVAENKARMSAAYDKIQKKTIRAMMLKEKKRLDGRAFDEIRPIWTEIDYLPSAHGSAIFNRGETQSLTSLTLGTKTDQQMVDIAHENSYTDFILHYNFPAFSVGESKPMRGPGRREVGHANLAARSIRQVLPAEMTHTIRIVSDILESNGSSSMATVCAGSLALMDGGVQITRPVAGIAMGMVAEGGDIAILSDILGDEDALGDMDFKLTGTEKGITACQMDIKIDGLPYEQLEQALEQARVGRLHILGEMNKTIAKPNPDLKPHAPRIVKLIIDKSYIGAVIGPGGKIIQELQELTKTTINIDEIDGKGHVSIASSNKENIEDAVARIKKITFTPEVGGVYTGTVKTIVPYGVFVGFEGGKDGLLHVSEMSHSRIDNVEDVFQEGDEVTFKIVDIDERTGKLRLSRKAIMPRADGSIMTDEELEEERQASKTRERGDRGDRGDRRGGGRDRGDRGDRRSGGGGGGGRDRDRRDRRD
ncbi:polyribonucleotide nucleotidyltransferase [Lewinella lacunae]|uniref:Polyribonucleotide nucleotidyltransferase n=1 Tax=Neolewinella lacunae TaxID=1517758 RepID=A0A923PH60_9BACT|nr:polyribonucleotide nucleotidyltransferase [Neolewinella lacunae]MBC6992631.1 polyribonucleotide nucleotidyltransferase [Neolewinella lacunae]